MKRLLLIECAFLISVLNGCTLLNSPDDVVRAENGSAQSLSNSDSVDNAGQGNTDTATGSGDVNTSDQGICSLCNVHAHCTGTSCICDKGFIGDGLNCSDIDECVQSDACADVADCVNLPGSYECACPADHVGDGYVSCVPRWTLEHVILENQLGHWGYAVGSEDKIFFAIGTDVSNRYLKSYDLCDKIVREETLMPANSHDFCGCGYYGFPVQLNNWIFMFGNYGQRYSNDAWYPASLPPENMRGEAGTAPFNDKVYMVGGRGQLASVQYYDPYQDAWSAPGAVSELPWGIEWPATVVIDNKLYVIAGDAAGTSDNKMAFYDGLNWTVLPDTPFEESRPRAVAHEGQAFVLTEHGFYVYEVSSNSWLTAPVPLPAGDRWYPVVAGSELFVIGDVGNQIEIHKLNAY